MHETSKNSLRLVDNLLNISQIELGIVQLKILPHDYIYFIKNIISFYQLFASDKQISITFQSAYHHLIFNFDDIHIDQVVSNLIMNAIKFSNAGSKIKVGVSKTDSNILTEIVDEGVGIPEKEVGTLFNFFQKTSAKPTSGEKGSGLGLAIAKKIVTTHGGTIGVQTEVGKGSNFYFCLPEGPINI